MARTIFIGDIHGCWDELCALLDKVALTDDDVVVSVGDLVDRGPDPTSVINFFRRRPNAVAVCGNHERKHVRGLLSFSQQITRCQLGDGYADAVAWMGTLPYWWACAEAVAVHAAVVPGVAVEDAPTDVLSGTTSGLQRLEGQLGGRYWHDVHDGPLPVVFGHHVVDEPLIRPGRAYGIDTGVCFGGRLTALIVPSFELVSVPSTGDHWPATIQRWEADVLRGEAWEALTFGQLDKRLASRAKSSRGRAYLESVRAWSEAMKAAIPLLSRRCDEEIASMPAADDGRCLAAHPAGATLVARLKGRLSSDWLGCAGPGDVRRLAGQLGVALPPAP
jgi:serine/threonine protein phosphatase 1